MSHDATWLRRRAPTLGGLVVVLALMASARASEPVQAVRGLAHHVDVEYAARLRSRSDQSPTSPVLVRVSPISETATEGGSRQRIEFIGSVPGTFDLRDFVEREDGRAVTDLASLPIVVGSRLPPDVGTDLYSSGTSWFNWAAHYRTLLWCAIALWMAIPAAFLIVRRLRRPAPPPPAPAAAPPPTIEEQLIAAIRSGSGPTPTADERGRLELLVFRYFNQTASSGDATAGQIANTFRAVRLNPETRPVIVALEQWLHARDGERSREEAARALESLRASRLQAVVRPAGVTP